MPSTFKSLNSDNDKTKSTKQCNGDRFAKRGRVIKRGKKSPQVLTDNVQTIAVVCGLKNREQSKSMTRKKRKEVVLYIMLSHAGQCVVWHALEIAIVVVNVEIQPNVLGVIVDPTFPLVDGLV